MIIVMGSINDGERVRSKVRGIGSSGELDFRDAIRERENTGMSNESEIYFRNILLLVL